MGRGGGGGGGGASSKVVGDSAKLDIALLNLIGNVYNNAGVDFQCGSAFFSLMILISHPCICKLNRRSLKNNNSYRADNLTASDVH